MDKLAGKIALITGGGSGIGRATSLKFAECGMDIAIVTTSQSDQEGRALLKELGMPFRTKAIN
mgnify:CR=1 FL=1